MRSPHTALVRRCIRIRSSVVPRTSRHGQVTALRALTRDTSHHTTLPRAGRCGLLRGDTELYYSLLYTYSTAAYGLRIRAVSDALV